MIGCGLEIHVNDRVKHPTRSVLQKLIERLFDFLKGLLDVFSNHRGVQLYDHLAAEVGRAKINISVGVSLLKRILDTQCHLMALFSCNSSKIM
ncbi:hypothetical protein AVEN_80264-1 [Araneus ventricosus]|uniref:Uncharacterized protein n=1 Tax=Araneus ventricosus TaxID=182803 RepID=A0A4Y2MNH1_ARAVE|nr:hypothetical protein AVEN_80264-1 [Araneus ventricosus]